MFATQKAANHMTLSTRDNAAIVLVLARPTVSCGIYARGKAKSHMNRAARDQLANVLVLARPTVIRKIYIHWSKFFFPTIVALSEFIAEK